MTLLADMKGLQKALDEFKAVSAKLACGSSCCPHSRDRGGMMLNGPCRCYPHDHPMRQYVMAAARLRTAAADLLPKPEPAKSARLRRIK